MLSYWPKLLHPFLSSTVFSFLFFLSIGWYCWAGVFELTGCKSLSRSLSFTEVFYGKIVFHSEKCRCLSEFYPPSSSEWNLRQILG